MRDIDKLDAAFQALMAQGVYGFHNHYCCGGCAGGDIAQKHEAGKLSGAVGAVYYHEQSAESAIDGHGLTLYYDALPTDGYGTLKQLVIGELIVAALRGNGLQVEWDGNPETAIEIPDFKVRLDEIPVGEGSGLHSQEGDLDYYDEDEDRGW